MSDWIAQDQIARLEACVDADPGASEFPALAEALRRAGRLEDAENVARRGLEHKPGCLEGSLVLALILLDQGRLDDARRELAVSTAELLVATGRGAAPDAFDEAALAAGGFAAEVSEGELERAFEVAEPDRDQIVDADRVAHEAMLEADLATPENISPVPDPMFATRTMAELLESQGDAQGASQIRASLQADGASAAGDGSAHPDGERVVAVLESWLANLRSVSR